MTIIGTNFEGATATKFGSESSTSFTVNSESSITAVSPRGTGTVHVTVTNPVGISPTGAADQFSYIAAEPLPAVRKLSPRKGHAAGGASVTLTGTHFTGATAVKFGSTSATSFKVNSATSITAVSPAGAKGTVDVTVTTTGGTSTVSKKDRFKYVR